LTYDVTIKIEHLLKYAKHLPALRDSGCLFVISAVESVDDAVLGFLDKGHTREDFSPRRKDLPRTWHDASSTFVPFTPWTTVVGYLDLLRVIEQQGVIEMSRPFSLVFVCSSRKAHECWNWKKCIAWLGRSIRSRWHIPGKMPTAPGRSQ